MQDREIERDEWSKLKTGMRMIIPPNLNYLCKADKIKVEESIYRLQIMHNHGFLQGEYDKITRRTID